MKINTIGKEQLLKQLREIANMYNVEKDIYAEMYPYYLNFFNEKNEIKEQDLVIGIGFTYSWMPTILKNLNLSNKDEAVKILNDVKKGKVLDKKDLIILKKVCNNSLVGASKLLHFINPNEYAIWDSKVYQFLNMDEMPYKYKLEKYPEKYLEYLRFLKDLATDSQFQKVICQVKDKVKKKCDISDLRALELLFFNGINKGEVDL